MPTWAYFIITSAAVVTALGVLWSRVVRPMHRAIREADRTVPVMRKMTDTFADDPGIFEVIRAIAEEFKSDSGSTARDLMNRLEEAAEKNALSNEMLNAAIDAMRINAEGARQLYSADRERIDRLIVLLARLEAKVDESGATGDRTEAAVSGVAIDLSDAHDRAEAHDSKDSDSGAGSAADAAWQRPIDEGG
jgi:hypothetical protein